ncbi:HAD-IA family hydrolase [Nocardioides anomalus]|uniref:HAD-IA family hydrolase n=1 Tax=Nocardioides anomalus TaxID=2712223 RepID=A0A6G6WGF6_9ACTN|nr:HAD-IA family hydrolase [Nocardioides anomalus]QIG44408.1 HAD-IA family hydrolase [Nocardioides anomalus]
MIEHVLLDADGVLQFLPGSWLDSLRPYLGERTDVFTDGTWHDDLAALRGETDFFATLAAGLTAGGLPTSVADLRPAVWHSIGLVPQTIALVRELRAAGYGVHLGSNQEQHRAAFMRTVLGYDQVFDVSCYSCDLGVTKPDPAFFTEAAARIGAAPETILFVDDTEANVHGARAAGLAAEHWWLRLGRPDRDLPRLVDLLARHGVRAAGR